MKLVRRTGCTSIAGDTTAGMQEVEQRREQLPRMSGAISKGLIIQTLALMH